MQRRWEGGVAGRLPSPVTAGTSSGGIYPQGGAVTAAPSGWLEVPPSSQRAGRGERALEGGRRGHRAGTLHPTPGLSNQQPGGSQLCLAVSTLIPRSPELHRCRNLCYGNPSCACTPTETGSSLPRSPDPGCSSHCWVAFRKARFPPDTGLTLS